MGLVRTPDEKMEGKRFGQSQALGRHWVSPGEIVAVSDSLSL